MIGFEPVNLNLDLRLVVPGSELSTFSDVYILHKSSSKVVPSLCGSEQPVLHYSG